MPLVAAGQEGEDLESAESKEGTISTAEEEMPPKSFFTFLSP